MKNYLLDIGQITVTANNKEQALKLLLKEIKAELIKIDIKNKCYKNIKNIK